MFLSFDECIVSIADRSAALRTAAAATDPDTAVPDCPDWSVHDLVVHVGQVQLSWAAKVAAGPAGAPRVDDVPSGDLLQWSHSATDVLTAALRDVGPDAPCWTWWEESDAPCTAGAVARHQVQEAALHAYDAQCAGGTAQPIPAGIATDCVDEFLVVSLGSMGPWPHPATRIGIVATDGGRWTLTLDTVAKVGSGSLTPVDAVITGAASDLILALYSRIPLDRLCLDGDRDAVGRLIGWAAEATS